MIFFQDHKTCSSSNTLFHGLTVDFFLNSIHFLCQKKGKHHYRTEKVQKSSKSFSSFESGI